MMMKNLIKTLWFILAVAWPSVAMATTNTDTPQWWTAMSSNIIHNKVCIESEQTPWEHCDVADVTIVDDSYACLSISKSPNLVPSNWNVTITCRASDNTKWHNFRIECGNENGDVLTWYEDAWQSFSRVCHYWDRYTPYNVACYVDDEDPTNPACETSIGYSIPVEPCWNGVVDSSIEQCDLWWKSGQMIPCSDSSCTSVGNFSNDAYYCLNCAIVHRGNFVYEPAECRYSDTPISVMNNEVVPYWWKLYDKQTQEITSDRSKCKVGYQWKTLLLDDPNSKNLDDRIRCEFAVYNWLHNQTVNSRGYVQDPIDSFTENCINYDEKQIDKKGMFSYFVNTHNWNGSKHPDWANRNSVYARTDGHAGEELWEYKLVLRNVQFKVCDTSKGEWVTTGRYWAICEVNLAITKPYIMQISTFGVNPVWSSNKFLENYYAMDWEPILTKSDLSSVIKTDNSDYAVDSKVGLKFEEFTNKYESLAIELDKNSTIKNSKNRTTTLSNVFGGNIAKVKKVPGKSIYFLEWNWTLVLSQDKIDYLTTAFTLIVKWMDVEIQWQFLKYAMIVTDKQMLFKDTWPKGNMGCADGWQVVQWIYVASWWFKAADEDLLNNNMNASKLWCPWWWLHVKWVLIWDNIEDISNNKRSQLNSWFNAPNAGESVVKKERRETIIKWASLLIEYSPSLRKTLPPWAEIFTEGLEIYRK